MRELLIAAIDLLHPVEIVMSATEADLHVTDRQYFLSMSFERHC